MAKPGTTLSELSRGNTDWEAFSLPTFYLGCRTRFSTMQPEQLLRYQTKKARNIVRYARRQAPFFGDLYRGHDTSDVWSLPTAAGRTARQEYPARLGQIVLEIGQALPSS